MASYRTDFFLERNYIRNSHFVDLLHYKGFLLHNLEVTDIRSPHMVAVSGTRLVGYITTLLM